MSFCGHLTLDKGFPPTWSFSHHSNVLAHIHYVHVHRQIWIDQDRDIHIHRLWAQRTVSGKLWCCCHLLPQVAPDFQVITDLEFHPFAAMAEGSWCWN